MAFGRSNGGGRRAAPREQAPVFVTFVTLNRSGSALLADFSTTGARLKGSHLPDAGEEIILRVEQLRTYATVAWSEDGECGVEFDMHLPPHVIESVRLSFRLLAGRVPNHRLPSTIGPMAWRASNFAKDESDST